MEFLLQAVTVGTVVLLAAMSPGPDFVLVSKNSILHGRSAGVWTALGIGSGIFVHIAYSLIGIGFIISQSVLLFSIIKYLGALYLIYIGWQLIRSKKSTATAPEMHVTQQKPVSAFRALREGFLTNALNPKATLFFLSLFTLVITPDMSLIARSLYGLEAVVVVSVWFTTLAYVLTYAPVRRTLVTMQHYVERGMGAVLIGLGITVALDTAK